MMHVTLQTLSAADIPAMWQINEEGLPGVGKVTPEALSDLLTLCEHPLGAYEGEDLVGFVLCLLPKTRYGSPNYAWFNTRYTEFLYVDRIAVGQRSRDRQIGAALYGRVIALAEEKQWPVAAEVSLNPPNPGSMRFHRRHGFEAVGELEHRTYSVAMVLRPPSHDPQNPRRADGL